MKKWEDNVLSGTPLNAVAGAQVQVKLTGAGVASLFSDAAGTLALANPVTTDIDGYYWFYVADGLYDLVFTGPGLQTITRTGIEILSDLGEVLGGGGSSNLLVVTSGGASAGGVSSSASIVKSVTGMVDGIYTDVLTVTVPNAINAAALRLTVLGILGAGGAVGQYEGTRSVTGLFSITRTPGLATVASPFTLAAASDASVAGGATVAVSVQPSANTGANGAQQTFTIQVRIIHGSGSSANHSCLVKADLINMQASGITIQ